MSQWIEKIADYMYNLIVVKSAICPVSGMNKKYCGGKNAQACNGCTKTNDKTGKP